MSDASFNACVWACVRGCWHNNLPMISDGKIKVIANQ